MWIFDALYDVIYFVLKSAEHFKWDALLLYLVYLFGKRSGMKMFKKWVQQYIPYLMDENESWKRWVTEQILLLGGTEPLWKRSSGATRQSRKRDRRSSNMLSKLLRRGTAQADQSERMSDMKEEIILVLDAGHGGTGEGGDPGAIGVTGRKEKDFNLAMVLRLRDLFQKNPAFKVHLTRSTDVFIKLEKRSAIANGLNADAFVSIHANSGPSATAAGTETWYTRKECAKFAKTVHKHVIKATGFRDRGVDSKSLSVCRLTTMPAILLEPGFMSNPTEEAKLFTEEFQNNLAQAVYEGVCEYFGITATAPVPSPGVKPDKPEAQYPKVDILVHTQPEQKVIGYSINNKTWIPSRPTAELLGGNIGYDKGKVTINGTPVETQLIDNVGYVWSRDFAEQTGAKVFWDKTNPNQVDIFPGGV